MSDSRDLLLAILAMDSYNREYDEGIVIEGDKIGSATFKNHKQSDVSEIIYTDWKSFGFYAAAYELPGETVMSFRGTDRPIDVLTGWPVGAGASFYGA
jgi:hypothetical protein